MDGNRKNVVVMTKETGYVRKPSSHLGLVKMRYLRYPKVAQLMAQRHIHYNEQLAYIERLQEKGQAFVIRPGSSVDVGRVEKDADKLKELYRQGYRDTGQCFDRLMEFLEH